ncbi:hypothetical protein ACNAN0_11435 [Agrilactobacillus fermenti]|uniref:hypothetical protein n=1 Tax=Agrilactobacillus fermenti TaxID=2586909 RepID=UPI001E4CB6FE|nr:hypothetical protein [Agrilactobacillus fermenti]MCD2255665.1 hypothetical protein [Agrilactobacillus fermenti]
MGSGTAISVTLTFANYIAPLQKRACWFLGFFRVLALPKDLQQSSAHSIRSQLVLFKDKRVMLVGLIMYLLNSPIQPYFLSISEREFPSQ